MNKAMWIAMTGLEAQQTRMSVISNNLANVNTMGFKRDRAVFEDLLYQTVRQPGAQSSQDTQLPSGLMLGTGVRTVATEKMHTQGNIVQTNNSLDVAVQGRGFLQVLMPDGSIAYTRDGALQSDSTGQLVTASGYQVQPAITIPDNAQSITIGFRRHDLGADPGPGCADPAGYAAARRFHQSHRPAADRPEPVPGDRLQRFAVHRQSGSERPGLRWCRARWRPPTSTWWRNW
jgi:flagellar hook-basal body protein